MKKHLASFLFLFTIIVSGLNAQIDINFYSLLWEDKDIAIEKLKQVDFKVVEESEDEESVNIKLEGNNFTLSLFCYNESRDSVVELTIIFKDKGIYADVLENNIQFDTTEFTLANNLVLGYDTDVFSNDIDWEISYIPIYSINLFLISISASPTFEWRKEMMEENTKRPYKEIEDIKHLFRKFALIKFEDGLILEEKMEEVFGNIDIKDMDINRMEFIPIDFSTLDTAQMHITQKSEWGSEIKRIKDTDQYQEYEKYILENVLSNEAYQSEFLKYGILLQIAMNLDTNKYNEMYETERDILSVYLKNEWLYTLVMLDYLCEEILR